MLDVGGMKLISMNSLFRIPENRRMHRLLPPASNQVESRELAIQIYNWTTSLADGDVDKDGLVQCVFKGDSVAEQDGLLKKAPRILIGTPNRLLSLYDEKMIDFSRLQTVIVDEVDKILIPLSRYATVKERYNRQVHTPPGEKLLDILSNQRKKPKVKRMGIGGGMQDAAKNQKLQWIVCSATLNSPMKALLKKKGWMTSSNHNC